MAEFSKGHGTLEAVASTLRTSAQDLEGAASAPPAPEAGRCTGAVLAALNLLAESTAGVSEGLTAVGNAVAEGNIAFEETDRQGNEQFNAPGQN